MTAPSRAPRQRATRPVVTPDPQHSTEYVRAWKAQSRTHADVAYTVAYDILQNAWGCQCPAYTYHGHCAHIEACIEAWVATWRKPKEAAA